MALIPGADGSEAVGVIKSISDPLTDTASALYEVRYFHVSRRSSVQPGICC